MPKLTLNMFTWQDRLLPSINNYGDKQALCINDKELTA